MINPRIKILHPGYIHYNRGSEPMRDARVYFAHIGSGTALPGRLGNWLDCYKPNGNHVLVNPDNVESITMEKEEENVNYDPSLTARNVTPIR